jgi:hypothetical protein
MIALKRACRTAGQCPERWEGLVEAESERQLADPPATWQEHWFGHRQLLRLYHSDEHCVIYERADQLERAREQFPGITY